MKSTIKRFVRFYPTVKLARPVGPQNGAVPASDLGGLLFARLGEHEVEALESSYPYQGPLPMRERLRLGDACYAVRDDSGAFGAFVWVASGRSFHVPEVAADVWVPDDVAYFYEAYTFPEMRGRGLMGKLLRATVAELARTRPPDHRCEAWVARRNKPSIRAFGKAGFEAYESFVSASSGPVRFSVGRPWLREGEL